MMNITEDSPPESSVDNPNSLGPISSIYQVDTAGLSVGFVVQAGIIVLLSHLGFTQMEAGMSRSKGVLHVYMKNHVNFAVCALCFFFLGFGFALGDGSASSLIGLEAFALHEIKRTYVWFTHFMFANVACTIYHGPVAGRMRFAVYIVLTALLSSFVVPVIMYWNWSPLGWLRNFGESGSVDAAGAMAVHITGGLVGFLGAVALGPRLDWKNSSSSRLSGGHNKPLAALGTSLVFIGFVAMCVLKTASVHPYFQAEVAGRIACVTLLASSSSVLMSYVLMQWLDQDYSVSSLNSALLSGVVSISASCACVPTWAALPIGALGACLQHFSSSLIKRFNVDDPNDSISIHLFTGIWSTLSVGLFADREFLTQLSDRTSDALDNALPVSSVQEYGLLMGGSASLLGTQFIALSAVSIFVFVLVGLFFFIARWFNLLRISREMELGGIDVFKHDVVAYPDFNGPAGGPGGGITSLPAGDGFVEIEGLSDLSVDERVPQPPAQKKAPSVTRSLISTSDLQVVETESARESSHSVLSRRPGARLKARTTREWNSGYEDACSPADVNGFSISQDDHMGGEPYSFVPYPPVSRPNGYENTHFYPLDMTHSRREYPGYYPYRGFHIPFPPPNTHTPPDSNATRFRNSGMNGRTDVELSSDLENPSLLGVDNAAVVDPEASSRAAAESFSAEDAPICVGEPGHSGFPPFVKSSDLVDHNRHQDFYWRQHPLYNQQQHSYSHAPVSEFDSLNRTAHQHSMMNYNFGDNSGIRLRNHLFPHPPPMYPQYYDRGYHVNGPEVVLKSQLYHFDPATLPPHSSYRYSSVQMSGHAPPHALSSESVSSSSSSSTLFREINEDTREGSQVVSKVE